MACSGPESKVGLLQEFGCNVPNSLQLSTSDSKNHNVAVVVELLNERLTNPNHLHIHSFIHSLGV